VDSSIVAALEGSLQSVVSVSSPCALISDVTSPGDQALLGNTNTLRDTPGKGKDLSADAWRVFTLADAYAPRVPLQFVVPGLFTLPSLSVSTALLNRIAKSCNDAQDDPG